MNWENQVQAESRNFSDDELFKLLSASSVARYGSLIYLPEQDNNALTAQQLRGFWRWVGRVVGAIVGIAVGLWSLGTLTIWGYLVFGGLGVMAANYIMDNS